MGKEIRLALKDVLTKYPIKCTKDFCTTSCKNHFSLLHIVAKIFGSVQNTFRCENSDLEFQGCSETPGRSKIPKTPLNKKIITADTPKHSEFENQTPLDGYPRLVNHHFSLMLRCPCKATF